MDLICKIYNLFHKKTKMTIVVLNEDSIFTRRYMKYHPAPFSSGNKNHRYYDRDSIANSLNDFNGSTPVIGHMRKDEFGNK
ncbi:MAG: hypothetical protein J6Y02_09985 [Pseudobutyrivibrio sp.]|nr:hypothetical protein [Pseudobutyrivibrio sp.]